MSKKIHDKSFEIFLTKEEIESRVSSLGAQIKKDFERKDPVLLGVLKGCFVFMADLSRAIDLPLEVSFIRLQSYEGFHSTGKPQISLSIKEKLEGRDILIVEDIVDTGNSIYHLKKELEDLKPNSVSIVALLHKPDAFRFNYPIDYVGFEIPNKFVVGYGLDYDDLGRNLPDIYQVID